MSDFFNFVLARLISTLNMFTISQNFSRSTCCEQLLGFPTLCIPPLNCHTFFTLFQSCARSSARSYAHVLRFSLLLSVIMSVLSKMSQARHSTDTKIDNIKVLGKIAWSV